MARRKNIKNSRVSEKFVENFVRNIILAPVTAEQRTFCQNHLEAAVGTETKITTAHSRVTSTPIDPNELRKIHYYTALHGSLRRHHGSANFLPWHREFLFAFESDLRSSVPYWDWTESGDVPDELKLSYLRDLENQGRLAGLNSNEKDEVKSYFLNLVRFGCKLDEQRCRNDVAGMIKRVGDFVQLLNAGSQSAQFKWYEYFSRILELRPHNPGHSIVGGDDGIHYGHLSHPFTATLDPIFWVHHSMIDRVWAEVHQFVPRKYRKIFYAEPFGEFAKISGQRTEYYRSVVGADPYADMDIEDLVSEFSYAGMWRDRYLENALVG